ncbi:MAG: hypothetical protein ACYDCC_01545 [Actinomycetota bacterium]
MPDQRINIRKSTLTMAAFSSVIGGLLAMTLVGLVAWSAGKNQASNHVNSSFAAPAVHHLNLTIATGLGPKKDWPGYIPSSFTLPANSTIVVTITDLDNATAMPATYAKVTGTEGNTVSVSPIDPFAPNTIRSSRTVSSLNPQTAVGHTFTIPQLGINVPVAAQSVETFTIHTGAKSTCGSTGQCMWHCYNPCGSGASGWAGPMSAAGFMGGTITLV